MPRREKGGRGRVEENSPLSERPSWSNDQKQTEIVRKAFVVVKPLYEQSPQNDFSCEVPGVSKQSAGKTPQASSLGRKIVPKPFLGLNYGSDSD
jgi:hypothetical protein